MPQGDGTGPRGRGPMTGKGRGFCVLQVEGCGPSDVMGFAGISGTPVYKTSGENSSLHKAREDASRKEEKMPGGNGTGPMGMGPMTGRAAGFCSGFRVPGFANPVAGSGMGAGRGRGCGRGWRNMFFATGLPGWQRAIPGSPVAGGAASYAGPTKEQELAMAKSQVEYFEGALSEVKRRIEELDSKETK